MKPSTLLLTTLLGSLLVTSCSPSPSNSSVQAPSQSASSPAAEAVSDTSSAPAPKSLPKLIKKAQISLVVDSIDTSLREASTIVRQQQGDLIGLSDNKPKNESLRHTASMDLRVPQDKLDATLEKLAQLGTVQRRTITAEDVTDQLVDLQARLRNLRKQEGTLLKIMERSGSVGDVLKVSQELSRVRETIEQIDAQQKSLQNQVAYSTITLQLEAAISTVPTQQPVGVQVKDTWDKATYTVSQFTLSLMSLGLWAIAFSPYLFLIGGAVYGFNRLRRQ